MSSIASSSKRPDGRSIQQIRPISLHTSQLDRADGSAKFSFGSTSALASFSGPIEVRIRDELIDRATLEIVHRPLEGVGATPSKALVASIQAILPTVLNLSQHPRSLLQIIIQSLSPSLPPFSSSSTISSFEDPDPSLTHTWPKPPSSISISTETHRQTQPTGIPYTSKAACINATSLAILDGGSISMIGVPISISLALTEYGMVCDPTAQEEGVARARFVLAWVFGNDFGKGGGGGGGQVGEEGMEVDGDREEEEVDGELVYTESEGEFTRAELHTAITESKEACRTILGYIKSQMEDKFNKR